MKNNIGQNWILLRGLTREAAHWGGFLPQLQKAFPDAQTHTIDLPGAGIFYQQISPDSIQEITRQIRQHAYEKGYLQTKTNLLAMSLGGMVAWEWLQNYPDETNSAILINTSLKPLNPCYQRLRWQCYPKLANLIFKRDLYQRELAILKLVSNDKTHHETIARDWETIQRLRPISWQNAKRQIIAAANYRPPLNKPLVSVLLLNSLGDHLVAPVCSSTISQRWSLPLTMHPWAGHDICIDDSEWVIRQLKRWSENSPGQFPL